jgi:hypothetical protein
MKSIPNRTSTTDNNMPRILTCPNCGDDLKMGQRIVESGVCNKKFCSMPCALQYDKPQIIDDVKKWGRWFMAMRKRIETDFGGWVNNKLPIIFSINSHIEGSADDFIKRKDNAVFEYKVIGLMLMMTQSLLTNKKDAYRIAKSKTQEQFCEWIDFAETSGERKSLADTTMDMVKRFDFIEPFFGI